MIFLRMLKIAEKHIANAMKTTDIIPMSLIRFKLNTYFSSQETKTGIDLSSLDLIPKIILGFSPLSFSLKEIVLID